MHFLKFDKEVHRRMSHEDNRHDLKVSLADSDYQTAREVPLARATCDRSYTFAQWREHFVFVGPSHRLATGPEREHLRFWRPELRNHLGRRARRSFHNNRF